MKLYVYKIQAKHIPAPAGGVVKTRLLYKFLCPSVRDQFYRLRKNEYGPTKEWVVLKTSASTSSSAAPTRTAGAAKRTKEQKAKKAKKTEISITTAATEMYEEAAGHSARPC